MAQSVQLTPDVGTPAITARPVEGVWNSSASFANIRRRPTAYLEGGPSVLACGYVAGPVRLRNQDKGSAGAASRIVQPVTAGGSVSAAFALQHLPYAPAFAVAAVVGKPVRVLCPRSEAVVGRERLRLPEAPILPTTTVGRILAANPHPCSASLSDHSTPPRRVAPTSII